MLKIKAATALLGSLILGLTAASATSISAEPEKGVKAGDKAPAFTLTDTKGNKHNLQSYLDEGKIVVLEWFNPDCPFVQKHHLRFKTMEETAAKAKEMGAVWIAINSGGPGLQGAGVERNTKAIEDFGIKFPVLLDETGEVGLSYGAIVTPHMYIITPDGIVAYQGAIDNNRSARTLGDTNYVLQALKEIKAGETVSEPNTKPYGCGVKYAKPSRGGA
ncbi:MAG: redoxin family protein [Phycisphaerales bacterium JB037]